MFNSHMIAWVENVRSYTSANGKRGGILNVRVPNDPTNLESGSRGFNVHYFGEVEPKKESGIFCQGQVNKNKLNKEESGAKTSNQTNNYYTFVSTGKVVDLTDLASKKFSNQNENVSDVIKKIKDEMELDF